MPDIVRPDKMFLKTANKAEDCVVALTDEGQICGALTKVHRVLPRGMGTVCYTSAIDRQELMDAIQHKKTKHRIINNVLCRPLDNISWQFLKSIGYKEYLREAMAMIENFCPHCDISMLDCKMPVLCITIICRPETFSFEFSYDKRPYDKDTCIMLCGTMIYKDSPEMTSRVTAIENWSKDNNLIRYNRFIEAIPLPPYAYNDFNVIAHDGLNFNFSEMQFRKEHSIIKNNPFIIYADWDRIISEELVYYYLKQGYDRCMKTLFSRPKESFDEIWNRRGNSYFTLEELRNVIKPQIDAYNQEIMNRYL